MRERETERMREEEEKEAEKEEDAEDACFRRVLPRFEDHEERDFR